MELPESLSKWEGGWGPKDPKGHKGIILGILRGLYLGFYREDFEKEPHTLS